MKSTLTRILGMGDVDPSGYVFFARYFYWADEGLGQLLRALGHPTKNLLERGQDLAVVAADTQLIAPIGLDDEVIQETWLQEVRRSSVVVAHEFRSPRAGLTATATMTLVFVTHPGMNPREAPGWLRAAVVEADSTAAPPRGRE